MANSLIWIPLMGNKKSIGLIKKKQTGNVCFFLGDHGRIQTCNLLSRNQVRYSVAPRGLKWGANIKIYC